MEKKKFIPKDKADAKVAAATKGKPKAKAGSFKVMSAKMYGKKE
jgi:hypothetical protein